MHATDNISLQYFLYIIILFQAIMKTVATRNLLLQWLCEDPRLQTRFSETKRDVDLALVSLGVRNAAIVSFHKEYLLYLLDEKDRTLEAMGIGCVQLVEKGEYINGAVPCFVFRSSMAKLRQVGIDYKACFGVESDLSEWKILPCKLAVESRGHPWDTAGEAFGYFNVSPKEPTGGINFSLYGSKFMSNKRPVGSIMGPQSISLSDPGVVKYAMDKSKRVTSALKKLIGDKCPDIRMAFNIYSH